MKLLLKTKNQRKCYINLKQNKKQKKIILKPLSKPNTSKETTIKFIDKVKEKIDILYIDHYEYSEYIQNKFNLSIINL